MNVSNASSSPSAATTLTCVATTMAAASSLGIILTSGTGAPSSSTTPSQLASTDLQKMAEAVARIIRQDTSQSGSGNPLNPITTGRATGETGASARRSVAGEPVFVNCIVRGWPGEGSTVGLFWEENGPI